VYGEYKNQNEGEEIQINLGYSRAHRADLKQIILEMMMTQDGGIPIIGQLYV